MRKLIVTGVVFLLMATPVFAQDFLFGDETKGVKVKISDDTDITARIRLQPRFDTGDLVKGKDGKSYEPETDIYLRRIRLELGGNLIQDLKYSLVFEGDKNGKAASSGPPTNEVKIQYANIDYKADDLFNLRFGKAKLPYSRISLTSSSKRLIIENPASTEAAKKVFDDYYQPHLLLHGKASEGIFSYNLAISDGWEPDSTIYSGKITTSYTTTCNTDTSPSCVTTATTTDTAINVHKSGILYIARVEVSPPGWVESDQSDAHLGKGRHLTIGANYAAQNGIEYKENDYEEDRTLTGFDISGHWNVITGQFEYNAWKVASADSTREMEPEGWYIQAGYFVDGLNIEPVVRYEVYDQDSKSDDKEEKTATLGINWYGKGHSFKIGTNWAHTVYDKNASGYLSNDDKKDVYQIQAQLYF